MELADYLRILRRRWIVLVVAIALGGLGASYATHHEQRTYETQVTFYASTQAGRPVTPTVGSPASDPVMTFAILATSPAIVHQTSASAPPDSHVTVQAVEVPSTIFLQVTVHADTAQAAYAVARSYQSVLPAYITQFQRLRKKGNGVTLSVQQPATLPTAPISPDRDRNLLIGLGLGLVVGFSGLLVAESLDNKIRRPEDIARLSGLPTLTLIPVEHRRHALVSASHPRSQRAEAIRLLRTNIEFAMVAQPISSMIVTSTVPDEGKTTVAANLAISFAAVNKRVVLVDADLRKASVAEVMGIDGTIGLTNVLVGAVSLGEAIQRWGDGDLWVLPAGQPPARPSELLGSAKMAELIQILTNNSDIVIFDTPPFLPVADAGVLAARTDSAIVVTRLKSTTSQRLRATVSQMERLDVRVLGMVANWTASDSNYGHDLVSQSARRRVFRRSKPDLLDAAPASPNSAPAPPANRTNHEVRVESQAPREARAAGPSSQTGWPNQNQ